MLRESRDCLEDIVRERTAQLQTINELLQRQITERKQAEEELTRYRYHLEEVLQDRTANLRYAHERLHQEMTERKQMEEELRELYEQERDLRQQLEAEINKKNLSVLDEYGTIDSVDHNPPAPGLAPGVEGIKQVFTMCFTPLSRICRAPLRIRSPKETRW